MLEDQLAGISGIDEITSVSRNGMSRITVTFELGYDLNTGVSDIRDAVARAQRSLPEEADDPQVFKIMALVRRRSTSISAPQKWIAPS